MFRIKQFEYNGPDFEIVGGAAPETFDILQIGTDVDLVLGLSLTGASIPAGTFDFLVIQFDASAAGEEFCFTGNKTDFRSQHLHLIRSS